MSDREAVAGLRPISIALWAGSAQIVCRLFQFYDEHPELCYHLADALENNIILEWYIHIYAGINYLIYCLGASDQDSGPSTLCSMSRLVNVNYTRILTHIFPDDKDALTANMNLEARL